MLNGSDSRLFQIDFLEFFAFPKCSRADRSKTLGEGNYTKGPIIIESSAAYSEQALRELYIQQRVIVKKCGMGDLLHAVGQINPR